MTHPGLSSRFVGLSAALLLSFFDFLFLDGARAATEEGARIQQEALIWTTDYEGLIDGHIGDATIAAIKKYQARSGIPASGTLTDSEIVELVKQGFAKRDSIKFQQYTDKKAGISVGIPLGLVPDGPTDKAWGKSWYSRANGIAIDTLRFASDVSLRELYDKFLTVNNRTVPYSRFVDGGWFVISAFEGDAAVYVRANLVHIPGRPDEIRGFSVWMSGNRPSWYQSIAPAMLSSFRTNTDPSHDVLSLAAVARTGPAGGEKYTPPPPSTGSTIKILPLPKDPLQVGPIATQDNKPPSVGNCFHGLGDCPMTVFALRP